MESILNSVLNKISMIWTAGTKLKKIYSQGTPQDVLMKDYHRTKTKIMIYATLVSIALGFECISLYHVLPRC